MAHLIGYARVSTDDQSLHLQLDTLTGAGCARIFQEVASGATTARPHLDAALEQLLPGDTLTVWRLDRLGRSLPHLIETVRALHARDVGFRSLTEGIDTTSATGELVFHLFGALAQFERRLTSERTHAGLAAAAERGRTGGRPHAITGEQLDHARRLLATEPAPSVSSVARTLGVKRPTLIRHLSMFSPQ